MSSRRTLQGTRRNAVQPSTPGNSAAERPMLMSPPPEETLQVLRTRSTPSRYGTQETHTEREDSSLTSNNKRKRTRVPSSTSSIPLYSNIHHAYPSSSNARSQATTETTPNPRARKQTRLHVAFDEPPASPTHSAPKSRPTTSPIKQRRSFEQPLPDTLVDHTLPRPSVTSGHRNIFPSSQRRSVTPNPIYEPPPEQFTPPREVIYSPTPKARKSARKSRASKSPSKSAKGKGKLIMQLKEMPEIDLTEPPPPGSPTEDPLLLKAPPIRWPSSLATSSKSRLNAPANYSRYTPQIPSSSPMRMYTGDQSQLMDVNLNSIDFDYGSDPEQESVMTAGPVASKSKVNPAFDFGFDMNGVGDEWSDEEENRGGIERVDERREVDASEQFEEIAVLTKADAPSTGTRRSGSPHPIASRSSSNSVQEPLYEAPTLEIVEAEEQDDQETPRPAHIPRSGSHHSLVSNTPTGSPSVASIFAARGEENEKARATPRYSPRAVRGSPSHVGDAQEERTPSATRRTKTPATIRRVFNRTPKLKFTPLTRKSPRTVRKSQAEIQEPEQEVEHAIEAMVPVESTPASSAHRRYPVTPPQPQPEEANLENESLYIPDTLQPSPPKATNINFDETVRSHTPPVTLQGGSNSRRRAGLRLSPTSSELVSEGTLPALSSTGQEEYIQLEEEDDEEEGEEEEEEKPEEVVIVAKEAEETIQGTQDAFDETQAPKQIIPDLEPEPIAPTNLSATSLVTPMRPQFNLHSQVRDEQDRENAVAAPRSLSHEPSEPREEQEREGDLDEELPPPPISRGIELSAKFRLTHPAPPNPHDLGKSRNAPPPEPPVDLHEISMSDSASMSRSRSFIQQEQVGEEVGEGEIMDDDVDTSVIKITSEDPMAAARAAAILRMHKYDCLEDLSAKSLAKSHSHLDSLLKSSRRKSLNRSGIIKNSFLASQRRRTPGGEKTYIPGSPALTLNDLLKEAEASLVVEGNARDSSVSHSPFKLPPPIELPREQPKPPGNSLVNSLRLADVSDTSSMNSTVVEVGGDPPWFEPPRVSSPRDWGKNDWKQLDACYTEERLALGESMGMEYETMASAEDVDLENVVDRFIGLSGGVEVVEQFGDAFTRENIMKRVRALKRKQASGKIALPSRSPSVLSTDHQVLYTPSSNHYSSFMSPSTNLLNRSGFNRSLRLGVGESSFSSSSTLRGSASGMNNGGARYSELMGDALAVADTTRTTESVSSTPVLKPAATLENLPPPSPHIEPLLPNRTSHTLASRMKGLLFSYLPNAPKPAATRANKRGPPRNKGPTLPIPPPEIFKKPRGPIATPVSKPAPKSTHPKELVRLHPAPPPKPAPEPKEKANPRRLVELHPVAKASKDKGKGKEVQRPVPIVRNRKDSGASVKDLIRSFDIIDKSHMVERMKERGLELRKMRSQELNRKKPVWKP